MSVVVPDFAVAKKQHQAGQLAEAEHRYRAVLAQDDSHTHAWYLLGVARWQQGDGVEAEHCLRQAIQRRPDWAAAHNYLGMVLANQKRQDEAVVCFREAIRLQPDLAEAHHNLGSALREQGQTDEAQSCFQQAQKFRLRLSGAATSSLASPAPHAIPYGAVDANPAVPQQPLGAGMDGERSLAVLTRGEVAWAIPSFLKHRQLPRDDPEALHHRALGLLMKGQAAEAAEVFRQTLQRRPDHADAHNGLALALYRLNHKAEALTHWREAVRLGPLSAQAHNNLGLALLEGEELIEAESHLRKAVHLQADLAEAHHNLSAVLWRLGRLFEARKATVEALRLQPDFAEAHNNLGNAYHAQGQIEEALACFERSIELKPDYADPHLNRALSWLVLGRWDEGWAEYEWRWKLGSVRRRDFPQPLWDGSPLEGRIILLHSEQGLGDTLNFIRYSPLVQARGGRVVVLAPKSLLPLLASCRGIDQLVAFGEPLPEFDVHAALLSLPRLFGTRPDNVPADVPYLHVDPQRVQRWRLWLTGYAGFKVGIAWQGDRKHFSDRQRSVPLTLFTPLAQLPGVQLFSLQKGAGTEQLADCPFAVTDLGSYLDNTGGAFMDTAAVMQNLDLVVCVDTALGHLAGGLGVPVWLALPFAPDWRWLRERSDTPWYPTMHLFRQPRSGDWESGFAHMAAELHNLVMIKSASNE
jgi:tetratricopeptide (TPR) repeat protein